MTGLNSISANLTMVQNTMQERVQEVGNAKAPVQQHGNAKDPGMWEVSLKFEALLMQQMMTAMRKTVPTDGMLSSGFANDMYSSMFDQAIVDVGSKSGGLGMAENIYRQMNPNNETKANPISADINTGDQSTRSKE